MSIDSKGNVINNHLLSNKDKMINALHKIYRKDSWVAALFEAAGIELDKLGQYIDDIYSQYFFDTATDKGLDYYEREAALKSRSIMELDDRRAAVEAKWKSSGKVDIFLIQEVADSWRNGEVEVSFVSGKIKVEFKGDFGIPKDLESLKKAIEDVKPEHLAILYAFKYLLIEDIHEVLTIDDMQALTLDKFAG